MMFPNATQVSGTTPFFKCIYVVVDPKKIIGTDLDHSYYLKSSIISKKKRKITAQEQIARYQCTSIIHPSITKGVLLQVLVTNTSSNIYQNGSHLASTVDEIPKFEGFDWNEREQGSILGAYFWLHWTTQIPGGILAGKYGTKLVFGLSNFISGVLCVLMPIAAFLGYRHLLFVRCVQGIIAVSLRF